MKPNNLKRQIAATAVVILATAIFTAAAWWILGYLCRLAARPFLWLLQLLLTTP